MIGLAMLGFILMDATSNNGNLFGNSATDSIGKVAGESISYQEFEGKTRMRFGNAGGDVYAQREAIWNMFVEEAIVKKEADILGLSVPKLEINELLWGPNYSPIIQRDFPSQQMRGMVDVERVNQIKEAVQTNKLNPQFAAFWMEEEKDVINDQLKTKLGNLVAKGIYTPNWMVEMQNNDINSHADLAFVRVPFDEVEDSQVKLEDKDFQNYLAKNPGQYVQKEPTVNIAYIAVDVLPSAKDSADIKGAVSELMPKFAAATDDSLFVNANKGSIDAAYVRKGELAESIADSLFAVSPGRVLGPYIDGSYYKAVKLLGRTSVPDSVQARHILISAQEGNPMGMIDARKKIDSLYNLIVTGKARFDSLAVKFSQDPGSGAKGGDLGMTGWPSPFVKPFANAVFFEAKQGGRPVIVETQFGVHMIEVTKTKSSGAQGVKVAYVERPIIPSQATLNAKFQEANQLAGNNRSLSALQKTAKEKNLKMETAYGVPQNAYMVQGLGNNSRDLVRWAWADASLGEVSPKVFPYRDEQFFYNNKYVVACLASKNKAGAPSLAVARESIEPLVRNLKKAEIIEAKIKGDDLAAIAQQFSAKVDTASNVAFSNPFLPNNAGREPVVVAAGFGLEVGKVSKPIVGENGVYVVKLINKIDAPAPSDIPRMRKEISGTMNSRVKFGLVPALKEITKIKDNRSTFF